MDNIPHNLEAEKGILGCILKDNVLLQSESSLLTEDDFYRNSNRLIFKAIKEVIAKGLEADTITVCEHLKNKNELDKVGGVMGVSQVQDNIDSLSRITSYVKIVLEESKRRKLRELAQMATSLSESGEKTSDEIIDEIQSKALAIQQRSSEGKDVESIDTLLDEFIVRFNDKQVNGADDVFLSGYDDFDKVHHGFHGNQLIILAGRPGMGKTTLALNIAANVCEQGKSVLIFTLEMTKQEIVASIVSRITRVLNTVISHPEEGVTDEENLAVMQRASKAFNWKLSVASEGYTVEEIARKARRVKAEKGLDLIVVDYLQLMHGTKESRVQEIAEITGGLKEIAKKMNIAILCLSQLNRAVEQRENKRPKSSDLLDGGSIEANADVIMLLYRDDYYTLEQGKTKTEVIVTKYRGSQVGITNLAFKKEISCFENYSNIEDF